MRGDSVERAEADPGPRRGGLVNPLRNAETSGEQQARERVLPNPAGGKINSEGIKRPSPGGDFCAAQAERVFGAEVDGNAGERGENTVDGENDERRGERIDAKEPEDEGKQSGIERGHDCGGPAQRPVRRGKSVAGGEGARDPAHLPAECFIVFVSVGQVAIGEEDDHEADGQRYRHCGQNLAQPAGRFLLRGRIVLWASGSRIGFHGIGSFDCFIIQSVAGFLRGIQ